MVGGDKEVYEICKPIFEALSADGKGYGYMGKSGSGHFVKMIHNGIEYGMMQSMAEGIEILNQKKNTVGPNPNNRTLEKRKCG